MAKAVADPDELRHFAHALKKFTGRLQGEMTAMQGALSNLGGTWRDQEFQKFASEFEDTMRQLQRFGVSCEEHVPFLLRKADKLDEYLQQR